jgi:uncharacterized protein (DUF697 family)
MAGKKLPRAVNITAAEMRGAAAVVSDLRLVMPRPQDTSVRVSSVATPPATGGAQSLRAVPTIEIAPAPPAAAATVPGAPDAAQIKTWAQDIVHRHATYSVFGGIIPLPLVNVASVAAINIRMVKVLSQLYGVPFEHGRARALVIGLMGGIMPTGIGAVTASALLYVIPGSSLVGLAMSSVTAAACTRAIGRVFVEHFAGGATSLDVPIGPR